MNKMSKKLSANILFPEIQKELSKNPSLAASIQGIFILTSKKGKEVSEW
jgi:hypothetical protein